MVIAADERRGHDVQQPLSGRRGTVLLVANYAPDVGFAWWLMENFWVQFAEVARSSGFTPLLAYPRAGEVPAAILAAELGTIIQRFPGRGLKGIAASLRLIRRHRVRYLYLTDRPFTSVTYGLFRLFGVRMIVNHDHVPGDRQPSTGTRGWLKALWRRLPFINCDMQFCVSPLMCERALTSGRIPSGSIALVQNGIRSMGTAGDRSFARRAFGLPAESLICINVGRAHANKRIEFIVEVARLAVHEHGRRDLFFIHCGEGPEMDRLSRLVEEADLKERFILAGRRSDVDELLISADLALHAARGEAFSLAILEYMRGGLAVLVPDIPTVSQAIDDGRTGVVYRAGDAPHAAALLVDLCANPVRRRSLGEAAAVEVRERYALDRMNEVFRSLVSESLVRIR